MISREHTNLYLSDLDLLAEALYICWKNSCCEQEQQINKVKLRKQIHKYGYYEHKNALKKEIAVNHINKFHFKTLTWANKFSDSINENTTYEYEELYKRVIKEIESNLFRLINREDKIAYANILLSDFDKDYINRKKIEVDECENKYRLMLELILDRKFISDEKTESEHQTTSICQPNYDLTSRLFNHIDFIDKLINLFSCFHIDLIELAVNSNFNLYIFNEKCELKDLAIRHDTSIVPGIIQKENNNFQNNILPKFNTNLSNDCLLKIMQYFSNKKMLDCANSDIWLFWFNRKYIKNPQPIKWRGTATMLSNVIQHVCGESIASKIKTAFCTTEYTKPTRKIYEKSKTHKEIEQIITISKQKN